MTVTHQQKQLELIENIENQFKQGNAPSTLVPVVEDFAQDNRICLTLVMFPEEQIKKEIFNRIIDPLKQLGPTQYFYPPDSLHFTVQTVKKISDPPNFTEADIVKVQQALQKVFKRHRKIILKVQRLFELPTSIGLCTFSDEEFSSLVIDIQQTLKEIDFPSDQKQASETIFFSNCTFCRFLTPLTEELKNKIAQLKDIELGTIELNNISLVAMNAVCHPSKKRVIQKYILD